MKGRENTRKIAKIISIILVVGLFAGYVFKNARPYLSGPSIHIQTPSQYEKFSESLIEISGEVDYVTTLFLNDKAIDVTSTGIFSEKMLLSPGHNVLKLHAEDRFGRTSTIIREVILFEKETTSIPKEGQASSSAEDIEDSDPTPPPVTSF